ncbi:unnamed protein product [Brassica rapa subsp. trilocularis]
MSVRTVAGALFFSFSVIVRFVGALVPQLSLTVARLLE